MLLLCVRRRWRHHLHPCAVDATHRQQRVRRDSSPLSDLLVIRRPLADCWIMDHLESGIKVELNNPLSNNPLLNNPLNNQTPRGKLADVTVHLVEFVCPFCRRVGGTHGVTEAQFCLRWSMQCGIVTIPKSSNAERIKEVTHSLALVYIHYEYCMSIHNTLLAHSIGWLAGWLFLPSFLSY